MVDFSSEVLTGISCLGLVGGYLLDKNGKEEQSVLFTCIGSGAAIALGVKLLLEIKDFLAVMGWQL